MLNIELISAERFYRFPIVGMKFRPPALAILNVLPMNCEMILQAEPTNAVDPLAVAVMVASTAIPENAHEYLRELAPNYGSDLETILGQAEWHIGYIPKVMACLVELPDNSEGLPGRVPCLLGTSAEGAPRVFAKVDEVPKRGSIIPPENSDSGYESQT